ncbi:hypothetical protein BDZ88DRAFT_425456 [Geranomyces variabilis]|nr:hypothetical protein BDZ88DRAFT_425456 [Geranomyces variabilis]
MQLQARPLARSAKFRFRLAQRDRTCVLTTAWEDGVVAAHIIPHEWQSTDMSRLPQHIREVLGGLEGGIGSFENGMLLDSSAHTRFDNGHWGVVWKGNDTPGSDGGVWEVVAITSEGAKYAGKPLRWPEGIRDDGVRWRDLFPPPELLHFHLQCAIFKHCTGRGDGDDMWEDYDHAATKVLTSEEAFERWAKGAGRIVPLTIDKSGTAAEAVL